MGLDMYLDAEITIFSRYNPATQCDDSIPQYELIRKSFNLPADLFEAGPEAIDFKFRVGYWRKANAIHAWFIRHQEEDDCKPVCVSSEELAELRAACQAILERPTAEVIDEVLPPRGGLFFGPTNIDDPDTLWWYLKDLADTLKILDRCDKLVKHFEASELGAYLDFSYHASW